MYARRELSRPFWKLVSRRSRETPFTSDLERVALFDEQWAERRGAPLLRGCTKVRISLAPRALSDEQWAERRDTHR